MVYVLWVNKRNRCVSQTADLIPLSLAGNFFFSVAVSTNFGNL